MIHANRNTIKRPNLFICIMLITNVLRSAPFIYVANGSTPNGGFGPYTTVYSIDAATNDVIAIIDIGAKTCYDAVAITPDGKTVLVGANKSGNGILARIDVATNTHLLPDISLSASPESLAILPNGSYAYVSCDDNTVNRINLATNMVDSVISGFNSPYEITAAPNSLTIYVNEFGSDAIIPVRVSDNAFGTSAPALDAYWMAVSPDNKYLYVADVIQDPRQGVQQYDLTNPLAPNPTTFINIGPRTVNFSYPGLALTADGKTLYVTDSIHSVVIPIDLTNPLSPVIQPSVAVGISPWIIAITPDGDSAYISDNGSPGTVTELDITSRLAPTLKATIDIGTNPAGLAITPINLLSPASISGCKTRNVFLLQTDYINNITWTAPASGSPVAYNIYRDAALTQLVATVPASGALQYYDHGRNPNVIYSYYITSVDSNGNQSTAASVTVTSSC